MTDTHSTHDHPTTLSAPTQGTPKRSRAAVVVASLAFAAIGGAAVVAALDDSGGRTGEAAAASVDRAAPAEAGFTMSMGAYADQAEARAGSASASGSADSLERRAQGERDRLTAACRATVVAPDALERCLTRRGG